MSGGVKRYTENFYKNTNKKELKKLIGCFIYVNNFYDHPPACHLSNPACFYQLCFHGRLMNLGSRWRYLLAFDHYFLALSLRTHLFKETPRILYFFICILALGFLGRNGGLLCSFSVCCWSEKWRPVCWQRPYQSYLCLWHFHAVLLHWSVFEVSLEDHPEIPAGAELCYSHS